MATVTSKQDLKLAAFESLCRENNGRLSPQILLDHARDPSSPFHEDFEWNDDAAADKYRLVQASVMIRRWKGSIIRIDQEAKTISFQPVRRVQSPRAERGSGRSSYVTVEDIMADPELRKDMLQTALKELQSYRRRYSELSELAEVWAALDTVAASLGAQ